jgi:hypothetical protein
MGEKLSNFYNTLKSGCAVVGSIGLMGLLSFSLIDFEKRMRIIGVYVNDVDVDGYPDVVLKTGSGREIVYYQRDGVYLSDRQIEDNLIKKIEDQYKRDLQKIHREYESKKNSFERAGSLEDEVGGGE